MVRILKYLANKIQAFNSKVVETWNNWLKKIKM